MNAYESAILAVQHCIDILSKSQTNYSFKQTCYFRWAADELLAQLIANPETPPLVTIENFRDQMEAYSRVRPETVLIFTTGKELSETIIDLLIN
jgi:hypothetical protein